MFVAVHWSDCDWTLKSQVIDWIGAAGSGRAASARPTTRAGDQARRTKQRWAYMGVALAADRCNAASAAPSTRRHAARRDVGTPANGRRRRPPASAYAAPGLRKEPKCPATRLPRTRARVVRASTRLSRTSRPAEPSAGAPPRGKRRLFATARGGVGHGARRRTPPPSVHATRGPQRGTSHTATATLICPRRTSRRRLARPSTRPSEVPS